MLNSRHSLILFVFPSAFLLLMASGFVFTGSAGINSFSHEAFRSLCHQLPSRTLVINDLYTAVCARCLGLYSGLFLASLYLWLRRAQKAVSVMLTAAFFIFALLLNLADVAGNFLGFWSNTVYSRILTGMAGGMALIFIIPALIYNVKNKTRQNGN